MSTVNVASGTIEDYTREDTELVMRVYLAHNFRTSADVQLVAGRVGSRNFYAEVPCTVLDGVITYDAFTLDSTTDALVNDRNTFYVFALFTESGALRGLPFRKIRVPATPADTDMGALQVYSGQNANPPEEGSYSSQQVDTLLALKANLASPTFTGTPAAPTAAPGDDSTQIATTAFVAAFNSSLAALNSPAFTGTPTAPTAALGTASTQLANCAFVAAAIAALINSAPGVLDTLDELAAALGDDANFAATVTTALAGKQPIDANLTAIAALATTAIGRSLLEIATAAAGRTILEAAPDTPSTNSQVGTTYTLLASDNGKKITLENAAAITVTVPTGLGADFHCQLIQKGAGQVSVSAGVGATVNNRQGHTKTAGQHAVAVIEADVADNFYFGGDTAV
jgi:hypothetical protein